MIINTVFQIDKLFFRKVDLYVHYFDNYSKNSESKIDSKKRRYYTALFAVVGWL